MSQDPGMIFASMGILLNEMRNKQIWKREVRRVFRRGIIHAGGFAMAWRSLLLIAGLGLMLAGSVKAQTFTTVHNFSATDGPQPGVGVISGNTLYGSTGQGGTFSNGTIFRVNTDGSGYTNLHRFSPNDGAFPYVMFLSGDKLYGRTYEGGPTGSIGTLFTINTDGTGFTNLYQFNNPSNGCCPAVLITSGNMVYGSAYSGGTSGNGAIFKISTDGTGYTSLHYFEEAFLNSDVLGITNNEGAYPGWVILSGDTLYGTASDGGTGGQGSLFKVNIEGVNFTNLHNFTAMDYTYDTNADGAVPGGLILSGNILYGTGSTGGSGGHGTVFKLNPNGTGFTTLYHFSAYGPNGDTNSDGATPGGLILIGHRLYGTAQAGGRFGRGTLFSINTDGSDFMVLHTFAGIDGIYPDAMILSGNTFYGAASQGGTATNGTVFSLSFAPPLSITRSSEQVILSWPTAVAGFDYAGYTLQSTTNPGSSSVWTTNLPAPVVVNGRYTVTKSISYGQEFFRLSE